MTASTGAAKGAGFDLATAFGTTGGGAIGAGEPDATATNGKWSAIAGGPAPPTAPGGGGSATSASAALLAEAAFGIGGAGPQSQRVLKGKQAFQGAL